MEKAEIFQLLNDKFGENTIVECSNSLDMTTLIVPREISYSVLQYLKENENFGFHFLTDLCGAHIPENETDKQFVVIYHLHNWLKNMRLRVKVYLPANDATIDSVVPLYTASNWQERETFDFYGIEFNNHPDLRRILNMDEMVSFPMRKEFPMEDMNRTDKDDRYFGRLPQNLN